MTSVVAATVATTVLAGASVYSAKEAHESRKEAKKERKRVAAEEKEKQAGIDAEIAAEKKAANLKARERMQRKGFAGTVLGGKAKTAPTLLGSVG